jgi:hypothetical protein
MIFVAVLMLSGCDSSGTSVAGQPEAVEHGVKAELKGCSEELAVDLDLESFRAAGIEAGPAELDRWRDGAGANFKAAGNALCAGGHVDPELLLGAKRLLVQYGAGADSAAVWQDEAKPDAVILQYAFSTGSPGPNQADVRDGIICWNDPNEARCAERLP